MLRKLEHLVWGREPASRQKACLWLEYSQAKTGFLMTGREEPRKVMRTPSPGQSRDPRRVCRVARGWRMGAQYRGEATLACSGARSSPPDCRRSMVESHKRCNKASSHRCLCVFATDINPSAKVTPHAWQHIPALLASCCDQESKVPPGTH